MPILIVSSATAGYVAAKPNARPAAADSQLRACGRLAVALLIFNIVSPLFDARAIGPGPGFARTGFASCVPNEFWWNGLIWFIYLLRPEWTLGRSAMAAELFRGLPKYWAR